MPAQRTGIGNGEPVRVVAVEMASGEITTQTLASLGGINSNSNSLDAVSDDYNQLASEELNLNTLENLEVLENVDNDTVSESDQVILKVDDSRLTNTLSTAQNDISEGSQEIQMAKPGNATEVSVSGVTNTNEKTSALKRQLAAPPSSNPVVTKVIITKNPLTSQPQPVPVNLNQVQLGQGQTVSMSSIVPGISILPGGQTPTKTITISPQGIVSSPGKQIIATIPSTPTKLTGIPPVNKVPISPAKTPTKITMIPVTIGKSPQRIAPASVAQVSMLTKSLSDSATLTPVTVATNSGTRPTMITMSPTKVFKQGTVIQQKTGHIQIQPNQTIAINKSQFLQHQSGLRPITISNVHQVQGSKFQYVRLVTPSSQVNPSVKTAIPMTSIVQAKNIVATTTTSTQPSAPQIKITLPVTGPQLMPKPVVNQTTQSVQRILLPAPSSTITTPQSAITLSAAPAPTTLAQIRPSFQANQLPPGTTILSGADAPQNVQGFALVPASYVAQIQQQIQSKPQTATPQTPQPTLVRPEFIPIASNDPNISANAMARGVLNGTSIEPTGARPRKPCNCTKSQCLKLYCDCFANGEFCHNCNCNNCANNLDHEEERSRAIKSCLDRNPMAFHPKIGKGKGKDGERDRRHNKGCNCKRSGCLKNYCECYEAKIMCSSTCKCVGCKNFEESPERKTLMHLADAAEVRVQQQTAAKSKLSSQISGIPSRPPLSSATGERLPYTFITTEVAEATCACLLAQAEEADKIKMPPVVQERMVIEEFGRCLLQIIDSANKTKGLLSRASSDKQPD